METDKMAEEHIVVRKTEEQTEEQTDRPRGRETFRRQNSSYDA